MWRAAKAGQPGVVYLLGSVHLDHATATLDLAITDAVIAADRLLFEVNPDDAEDEALAQVLQRGLLPKGDTLQKHLRPETYAGLRALLNEAGLEPPGLDQMRPWMLSVALPILVMEKRGFSSERGVDNMVENLARAESSRTREMAGLETAKDQVALLAGLESLDPDTLVSETVRAIRAGTMDRLFEAYRTGDVAALEEVLAEGRDDSPESRAIYALMIDDRNVKMLQGILPAFEREGQSLVVVGAAHVLGEKGLVTMLRERGAELTPVARKGPAPEEVARMLRPQPKVYRAEAGGFEFTTKAKVRHTQQSVPNAPGGRVELYQASLTSATNLVITVMKLAPGVEVPEAGLQKMASAMLQSMEIPAQRLSAQRVAGEPGAIAEGRSAARSGQAWFVYLPGRIVSIMALNSTPDPDPDGRAAADAVVTSFRLIP